MAEEEKKKSEWKKPVDDEVKLVRILSRDVRGNKTVYSGLGRIKGISWAMANALCKKLGIDKNKKVQELNSVEIKKIEEFMADPDVPQFIKNRRKDRDSGDDLHLNGADLNLQTEFDLKRLKKIKSYRGNRHERGLPSRGQRTKANFRKNKTKSGAVGMRKKK